MIARQKANKQHKALAINHTLACSKRCSNVGQERCKQAVQASSEVGWLYGAPSVQ